MKLKKKKAREETILSKALMYELHNWGGKKEFINELLKNTNHNT